MGGRSPTGSGPGSPLPAGRAPRPGPGAPGPGGGAPGAAMRGQHRSGSGAGASPAAARPPSLPPSARRAPGSAATLAAPRDVQAAPPAPLRARGAAAAHLLQQPPACESSAGQGSPRSPLTSPAVVNRTRIYAKSRGAAFFWERGCGGGLLQRGFICLLCLNSRLRNVGGRRIFFIFFSAPLLTVGFFSFLARPYLTHLMKRALRFSFTRTDLPPCPSCCVTTGALEGAPGSPSHTRLSVSFSCS